MTPNLGILTDKERDAITNPGESRENRQELITRVSDRVERTLADCELLYMCLRDDELEDVFDPDGKGRNRATAQHTLALLHYGLKLTGDDVTHRFAAAIEEAEAANDRDATVTLDVVTQPFLPPAQRVQALTNGNTDQVSAAAVDQLWYDDRIPASDVVAAFEALGEEDLTVADVKEERKGAAKIERMPSPVIMDMGISSEAETDGGSG